MKKKLSALLDNKRFYLVFSIVMAILYWLILSLSDDSNIELTIHDVPVQLDYNASSYQNFGLEVIGAKDETVSVTVEGPRSVVGSLKPEDFLIYPNVNSVTAAGDKELRLVCTSLNNTSRYTVTRLSKNSVSLRFDKIVTQKFTVVPDCSGVKVADGYLLSNCYATPGEITVTGPQTEVASIATARATLEGLSDTALSESKIVQGNVELLNAAGNAVDTTLLTVDTERVEINMPVLRKLTQHLKIQFLNVPQGFDISTLHCKLDHEAINVAVPTSYGDRLDDFVVAYIDFSTLDYSGSYTFQVDLPTEYSNLDNIRTVVASFDTDEYETRTVKVSNIRAINVPAGTDLNIQTKTIYNVQLVGPAASMELLDKLEKENVLQDYVVAQIDASKITVQQGQQTVAVQILLPSISDVFATGSYTAVISVG